MSNEAVVLLIPINKQFVRHTETHPTFSILNMYIVYKLSNGKVVNFKLSVLVHLDVFKYSTFR